MHRSIIIDILQGISEEIRVVNRVQPEPSVFRLLYERRLAIPIREVGLQRAGMGREQLHHPVIVGLAQRVSLHERRYLLHSLHSGQRVARRRCPCRRLLTASARGRKEQDGQQQACRKEFIIEVACHHFNYLITVRKYRKKIADIRVFYYFCIIYYR